MIGFRHSLRMKPQSGVPSMPLVSPHIHARMTLPGAKLSPAAFSG